MTAVHGGIVDARFAHRLPAMNALLRSGDDDAVAMEVATQLSANVVRCIALTPTRGLARGSAVADVGETLRAPVGERLLGRVFNVFGDTIDSGDALEGIERRPIYGAPAPIIERTTSQEVFEIGIKVIDLVSPLELGDPRAVFSALMQSHLFARLFLAVAESAVAENAARLGSMQSAERNIEERVDELSEAVRRRRQQEITEELLDISSGFEALASNRRGAG